LLIGPSIKSIHKFFKGSPNACISWWRGFQKREYFNAIEISMFPAEEKDFKLSATNYEWLESLKHVSYHLSQYTKDTKAVIRQLPYVNYFILHVDQIHHLTTEFLDKYGHKLLIENIEFEYLSHDYFSTNQICLDIAHAQSITWNSPVRFFEHNKYHIREIHCSCFHQNKKHVPFFCNKKRFPKIDMIEFSIIIEADFENIEDVKKELQYLKGKIYGK
jgi:hypothetical protein